MKWRLHYIGRQSLIDAMRSYVRLVYSECMTYLCRYGNVQVAIFKKNSRLNGARAEYTSN